MFSSQRLSHGHNRLQDFHIPAQPTRLREQGLVQRGNTNARERLTECYSKLTEQRAHRTGQGHQGYPKCRYNPSSSTRGPISPSIRSTCASTQPYADIRPLEHGLSKKYASRGQSPPKVLTLSRSRWPTHTQRLREVNKDLNTRSNTPSHLVHRYLFGQ